MSANVLPLREPRYSEQVAAEVRAEAARNRVTQQRLASVLGIDKGSMSRRMNGHQPFTVDELAAVADELHVPVQRLLPHLDSNQKPADLPMAA